MPERPLYVGIDLGTTNSVAAVFDGETVTAIRNAEGGVLTPSVVRIDRRGNVVVGAKARRLLETDPENTHAEFKRLMGTQHRFEFRAAAAQRSPEQLSSLVLGSLRKDMASQLGVEPSRAVVSVPALFELPQTSATSEAARLAGFEQIEMIQEPVASALASGWRHDEEGAWLVYDLGGGTFDASLLESREGVLRVVGHDGDNFLGGRDFDARVVDWLIEQLPSTGGPQLERKNPAHNLLLRRLRLLAEEAKIELSRSTSASIVCPGLTLEGDSFDVDLELSRAELEQLLQPLIDRTLAVCQRLLTSKGLSPGALSRVVLVGGPTVMPALRQQVAQTLGAIATDVDPMTVVAQGAALFAAAASLEGRPRAPSEVPKAAGPSAPRVWLQHPAMTADATPFVVGKLLGERAGIEAVQIRRSDAGWTSPAERLAEDGTFTSMVMLSPRATSTFSIEGLRGEQRIALCPASFSIIHGLALGEPPLSRSLGVALADNSVRVYAERGSPLPLRRTFTHRTVEPVSPHLPGHALLIPIVQGEFPWAHLCRLVGVLELSSDKLSAALPADSVVEVTIDLDRGGRLVASAHVPYTKQVFEEVARLAIPGSTPDEIEKSVVAAVQRAAEMHGAAFAVKDLETLKRLGEVDRSLREAESLADAARGGDADAAQRARRLVQEGVAALDELDSAHAWPALVEDVESRRGACLSWIALHGTSQEQATAERSSELMDRALGARNTNEVMRQLGTLQRLANAAFFRQPGAWEEEFHCLTGMLDRAKDPRRATGLLQRGRRALADGDGRGLEGVVRELWELLPVDRQSRQLGYQSGLV